MPDTTTPKTRTITLTDRAPVRIREDEWPVIAESATDSWSGHPGDSRYHQARNDGALDEWILKVRRHLDGRMLVYGIFKAASFTTSPGHDWRGGELLTPEMDTGEIVQAIHRVGENGDFPDHVIRECIADLPAEEI